jgi:CYTH domain-containing protein/thymidylate kinase
MKIHKFALTGGPCSGKSTALAYLCQKIQAKGYYVLLVPEAATICILGGLSPIIPIVGQYTAQKAIISAAQCLEDIFLEAATEIAFAAKGIKGIVIIYDRGIVDSKAYTSKKNYNRILKLRELDVVATRDTRYDAVFHLETAAKGAEEYYTRENNSARYETAEQARIQDTNTLEAWIGHPRLRIIDNSTGFEGKLRRLYAEVCSAIGIPVPIEREKKMVVDFDPAQLPNHAQCIVIEQAYLSVSDAEIEVRIRKRGQFGSYVYFQTQKKYHGPGERIEIERIITKSEYDFGTRLMPKSNSIIRKSRYCFVYENQYFELDTFDDPRALDGKGCGLLEIELTSKRTKIILPDWIKVRKRVTNDPRYSNFGISQILAAS